MVDYKEEKYEDNGLHQTFPCHVGAELSSPVHRHPERGGREENEREGKGSKRGKEGERRREGDTVRDNHSTTKDHIYMYMINQSKANIYTQNSFLFFQRKNCPGWDVYEVY